MTGRGITNGKQSSRLCLLILLALFIPTVAHEAKGNDVSATAGNAFAEATRLRAEQTAAANRQAAARYGEAAELWRRAGKLHEAAGALRNAGELLQLLGDTSAAIHAYETALSLTRRNRDRLEEARVRNDLAYLHFLSGDATKAQQDVLAALTISRALKDRDIEAEALSNLGETFFALGDLRKAQEHQQHSLIISRESGNQRRQAIALVALSYYYANLAQPANALSSCSEGLSLARTLKDIRIETLALIATAKTKRQIGDHEDALASYHAAKAMAERIGDQMSEVIALSGIGVVSIEMGDFETARDYLEAAGKIFAAQGHKWGIAENKMDLGAIYHALGQDEKALASLTEALALMRSSSMRRLEAITLRTMGQVYISHGDTRRALDTFQKSLALFNLAKDQRHAAYTLNYIGRAFEDLGRVDQADRCYQQALGLSQRSSDPESETLSLYNLAHMERARGDLDAARRQIKTAINIAEDVRTKVTSQDLRSTYFATVRDSFDLLIDVLMLQHKRDPTAGFDREAFAVSERARARSLFELLRETNGADVDPEPLTLNETQQRILNDETALLEFALGNERSYAWLVTQNSISSFELPARNEIESRAKRLYQVFVDHQLVNGETTEARAQREAKASSALPAEISALSKLLLDPLAGKLSTRRLLIVPDGALQYIPFQLLIDPDSHEPLIKYHELVNQPSASTLALVLAKAGSRKAAANAVAVLADPVFEVSDPRVTQNTQTSAQPAQMLAVRRALRDVGITADGLQIPRLLASGREANEIMALAPARGSLKAVGFAATRDRVFSSDIASYRIVHIATHGVINNERPEDSGIVLSLFDQQGHSLDGFLRLRDIYNLKLPADLVVLSACSTALGKDIRGEGLVGITRGFMYAGAAGVVASLWKVDDDATAELMKYFYAALFEKGLPPAAALRDAQLELAKHSRWQSPYYWAGFVIQGQYDQQEKFSQPSIGATQIAVIGVLCGSLLLAAIPLYRRRQRGRRNA